MLLLDKYEREFSIENSLFNNKTMKKTIILLAFFTLSGFLWSCGGNESKVRDCAQQYLDAAGNFRFDEARDFITEESNSKITIMENFLKMIPENEIQRNLPVTNTIQNIVIEGDTATVNFESKSPLHTNNNTIKLVKKGHKWLVDLNLSIPEKGAKTSQGHNL